MFATKFGWARVFPMQRKSEAHEGLFILAQRDGVPPVLVMDGAKEQVMGRFRQKARQMGVQIKQTEPYSPWQNAAEGAIREVKQGAGCKMAKMKTPAKLWDHCLELEECIRSHTALSSFRKLTEDELQDEGELMRMEISDDCIKKQLGKSLTFEDLKSVDQDAVTPEYELDADNFEGTQEHAPDVEDVTPEIESTCGGAEVQMLHEEVVQIITRSSAGCE